MIPETWVEFLRSDRDPYLWGSYAIAAILLALEVAVVFARERAILGHLGWPTAEEPARPFQARAQADRVAPDD